MVNQVRLTTQYIYNSNIIFLFSFPIEDATASTLACNDDGTSSALQLTATVKAGSAITAYWSNPWPHPTGPVVNSF
jgi:hypothetical protein